jgi:hypothetical protein
MLASFFADIRTVGQLREQVTMTMASLSKGQTISWF